MTASIAQVSYEAAITAFGSNIALFAFGLILFVILFAITRQSLASSLLLGMVTIDGFNLIANEPLLNILGLAMKIIILALIGYAIYIKVRG